MRRSTERATAGALLLVAGLAYEFAASRPNSRARRTAIGVALVAALLLVWAHLAVGIV
jgi:hypothetical protein